MKKILTITAVLCALAGAAKAQDSSSNQVLSTIAIGSCNRQEAPQIIWPNIANKNPELWVWLGDNIYGDSEDLNVLKTKYELQKNNPAYKRFTSEIPVIGIWDDHDYGVNDGGKEYPKKKESKELMFNFLDVPANHPARKREGAFQSYEYGVDGKRVKIILLDIRYFREELHRENGRYELNWDGKILGEKQWAWLEKELTDSNADMHIIGSGIQFIVQEHPYEKWGNFPKERQRMLDLVVKTQPKNVLFLSGDRHISEVASMYVPGYGKVFDFTSSGMTHSFESSTELNAFRISDLITQKSFGLMQIDWQGENTSVNCQMFSPEGSLIDEVTIKWDKR